MQAIETQWHKAQRAFSTALARNQLPEAEPLPPLPTGPSEPSILLQTVRRWFPHDGGTTSQRRSDWTLHAATDELQVGAVTVRWHEGAVLVDHGYRRDVGAPARFWPARPVTLQPAEWTRIRYNGRHSDWESDWWYSRRVINVCCVGEWDPFVFVRTQPIKVISHMALLR